LAAAQADLPKRKRRFWSRPLVALLYFLQPIERGLARYRAQLQFRSSAEPRLRNQGADAPDGDELIRNLTFWSDGKLTRAIFLTSLINRLEAMRWQFRADSGWSRYDIEINESRWSRLRMITATEQLDRGYMNIRCRLDTSWSLQAGVLIWVLSAAELIIASLLAPLLPWVWMLLVSLPVVIWFLEFKQIELRSATTDLLCSVARDLRFIRVQEAKDFFKAKTELYQPSVEIPEASKP